MFPLGMRKRGLKLLNYVEDASKVDIGPMIVGQYETKKATW